MAGDQLLFLKLAEALGQDSRALRAVKAGAQIPFEAMAGYDAGAGFKDRIDARKLQHQTLSEALGGDLPAGLEGFGNTTVQGATALEKPITAIAALQKAREERTKKGLQYVGERNGKSLWADPNTGSLSLGDLPGDGPTLPKSVTPTVVPGLVDPETGQPIIHTPGHGIAPAIGKSGSGTPVLKQGNEQAIGDVALMQTQAPNIDKLFDAYSQMGPIRSRLQATGAGSVLSPETKQIENSLKLAAFTFGGKNLTGQEKNIVFGAFFPSPTDNANSLEQKRSLLKNYFSGKIDLLQAANLLGPAGAPLKGMLQNKIQGSQSASSFGNKKVPSFSSEQEAEASGYKGPAVIGGKRALIN